MIEMHGLSKVYVQDVIGVEHGRVKLRLLDRRRVALQDLTLSVEKGEIFGLLGPNGAGKTTALKILMGLHFASSGTATIMGKPLGDPVVKERIGFLPENPHFYDYLRGEEFLEFYAQLYGMSKEKRRKRIPELLDKVGLTGSGELPLRGYSKGMIQRIGLAQALLNDPDVVFLDEPQSGLDPFGRKEVRDLILALREEGKTVFFSSHILGDAEQICDRVAILHKGRPIAIGPLSEMLSARIKEYEVSFTDPTPELLAAVEKGATRLVQRQNEYLAFLSDEGAARELARELLSGKGSLTGFLPRKETLEEYFIREIEGKRQEERARNEGVRETSRA